jgi:hypothetical protein
MPVSIDKLLGLTSSPASLSHMWDPKSIRKQKQMISYPLGGELLTFLVICGPVMLPLVEPSSNTQFVRTFLVCPAVLALTRLKFKM